MRRLLAPTISLVVLVATAAVASAHIGGGAGHARHAAQLAPAGTAGSAAVTLPAALPMRDAEHPEAYGYRSSAEYARDIAGPTTGAASPAPAASGASATVTVTAVVLPARTIVVDGHGRITDLWSNTTDAGARSSLYVVRRDTPSGAGATLDAKTWSQARGLFARANRAQGHVYGHGA